MRFGYSSWFTGSADLPQTPASAHRTGADPHSCDHADQIGARADVIATREATPLTGVRVGMRASALHRSGGDGPRERAAAPPLRLLLEPDRRWRSRRSASCGGPSWSLGRLVVPAAPGRRARRRRHPVRLPRPRRRPPADVPLRRLERLDRRGSSPASSPGSATAGGGASTTGTTRPPTRRAATPTSPRVRSRSRRRSSRPATPASRAGSCSDQGWLFFPLLTLEGLTCTPRACARLLRPRRRARTADRVRAGRHPARGVRRGPAGAAAARQGGARSSPSRWRVFGLCLGGSFAPSHKGMPIVPPTAKIDFLRRQVLMSRNVRGGLLVDFAMGGLNYQIEHHLFPSMPRPNLKQVQPLVRDYCAQHGVPLHRGRAVRVLRDRHRAT